MRCIAVSGSSVNQARMIDAGAATIDTKTSSLQDMQRHWQKIHMLEFDDRVVGAGTNCSRDEGVGEFLKQIAAGKTDGSVELRLRVGD